MYNKMLSSFISFVGRVSVVFVVCNSGVSDISIVGNVSIVRRVSSVSDVSKFDAF